MATVGVKGLRATVGAPDDDKRCLTFERWAWILFLASMYSAMRSEKAELTPFHSLAIDVVTDWMSWSIWPRMSRDAARSLWERRIFLSLNSIHDSGMDTLRVRTRTQCYRYCLKPVRRWPQYHKFWKFFKGISSLSEYYSAYRALGTLAIMHYTNTHFTYLLTYADQWRHQVLILHCILPCVHVWPHRRASHPWSRQLSARNPVHSSLEVTRPEFNNTTNNVENVVRLSI